MAVQCETGDLKHSYGNTRIHHCLKDSEGSLDPVNAKINKYRKKFLLIDIILIKE